MNNEIDINELILKSGMPFLVGRNNFWVDGKEVEISFNDMDDNYLKNCYNWSERWEKENTIEKEVRYIVQFDEVDSEYLLGIMKELAENKRYQLKEEMEKRRLL